jgi:hypothetical protein
MAIEINNKYMSEVEIDDLNLAEIYVDDVLIYYQPYSYEYNAGGLRYEITGVKDGETLGNEITLPSSYNDYSVKGIADDAFAGRSDVVSVTIPDEYENIRGSAFAGSSLETLRLLGESAKTIYSGAFDSTSVKNVYVPSIEKWLKMNFKSADANPLWRGTAKLYANNELITQLTIPEGIKSVPNYAFYGYRNLLQISIPEGVTSIGGGSLAFTRITTVTIPSTVKTIGQSAFYKSELSNVKFAEGNKITEIPTYAFFNTPITSINLPGTVVRISSKAFEGCASLPSIDLPEGVKYIDTSAFKGCSVLKEIVIPSSLSTVNTAAFSGAGVETVYYKGSKSEWKNITIAAADNDVLINATRLYYSEKDPVFSRSNYWHYVNGVATSWKEDCSKGHQPEGEPTCTEGSVCSVCGDVITPALGHDFVHNERKESTCTDDGWEAYTTCSRCDYSSGKVIIPAKGHTEVVDAAVAPTCTKTGLTEGKHCSVCNTVLVAQTEIPAEGHQMGGWIIGKEATETEDGYKYRVCSECAHKETVTIPAGNTIEPLQFTLNEGEMSFTASANLGAIYTDELHIPATAKYGMYSYPVTKIGKIGGDGVNPSKLTIGSNVKEIGEGAFEGCTNITTATIPSSVKKVGAKAFEGCTKLRHVLIDTVNVELGQEIFADCPSLRYIYYRGTAHEWGTIRGGAWREETDPNKIQTGAPHAVVCFYSSEQPSSLNVGQNTNYWHYNIQMPEYDSPALIWARDDLYDFMVMPYELPTSAGTLFDYGLFIKAKVSSNPLSGVQVLPEMYEGQPIIGIAPSGFHPQGYEVIETKDETGKIIDVKQVWRENKLRKLTGVIIPDTYKYIGLGAFAFCSGMGSLFIPKSVKYIDEGAFLETTQYIPPGEATYELVYDGNFVEVHEVYASGGESYVGSTSISWEENPDTGEEGWRSDEYGWLIPLEDDEGRWWTSEDSEYHIDVLNKTEVNVPRYKKTKEGTSEYHGGRTSINFEHYGAGEYWDSAWHRGMSHGKVTRPGYFTKLRRRNPDGYITNTKQITQTAYFLDTVFMNTKGYKDPITGANLGEGPARPSSARLKHPIVETRDGGFSTFQKPYYGAEYEAKYIMGGTGLDARILLEVNVTPDDVVETPKVGEAYKFGAVIPGDNKISTFLYPSTADGNMYTTSAYKTAVSVYLDDAEGGYYFYQKPGGSKTYINLNDDATVEYGEEASTVYQYDTDKKTLVTQIGKTKYCFGVRVVGGYAALLEPCEVNAEEMIIMRLYSPNSFYMGTTAKGDTQYSNVEPSEYFTLVPQQEGDPKLKLTENKNTLFKFEKAPSGEVAIVTNYEGQPYWLGILSDAQTNLRLIPGSPFRTYTEHGTIAQWGCKPSGYYKINASEISGTKELNASAEVLNIPDSLYGNDITTIADRAFSGAVATGASIGNNITSIGAHAFAGTKLQSIKIPLNVEVIKSGAFAGCKGIKIYCAAAGKPEGWADDWCDSAAEIEWAYCDDHRELTMVEESTCTTSGVTLHYCPNCDYAYMTDIKPALGHDWEELEYVKPTCEAQGYKRRRCRTCGAISGTNYTDALGHKYRTTIIKPTCSTAGWTEFTCTVCGDWYRDFYLPAFDHMPGEWETVKNPTHLTPGLRQQRCVLCGEIVKEETIPALGCSAGHTYKATSTTPPTCEADGYTTYTCELCGNTYIGDFVPSLGHDTNGWEVVKEPTCITEGLKRTVCQTCGLVEEQTMPPIPGAHTYQIHEDVESTCVEQGYTTMKCSTCGHEVTTSKKPVDHDWDTEVEVVQPTCSEQGYTIHTCNACGYTKTDSFTPATGLHKWGEWEIVIPPDCTVAGEQKCNCTDCGEAWAISMPKTEHTESDWIIDKEPTTEEEGLKHKECTFCGYKFPSITIPKLEETDNYILTESGDFLTDEEGNKLIIEGE